MTIPSSQYRPDDIVRLTEDLWTEGGTKAIPKGHVLEVAAVSAIHPAATLVNFGHMTIMAPDAIVELVHRPAKPVPTLADYQSKVVQSVEVQKPDKLTTELVILFTDGSDLIVSTDAFGILTTGAENGRPTRHTIEAHRIQCGAGGS